MFPQEACDVFFVTVAIATTADVEGGKLVSVRTIASSYGPVLSQSHTSLRSDQLLPTTNKQCAGRVLYASLSLLTVRRVCMTLREHRFECDEENYWMRGSQPSALHYRSELNHLVRLLQRAKTDEEMSMQPLFILSMSNEVWRVRCINIVQVLVDT